MPPFYLFNERRMTMDKNLAIISAIYEAFGKGDIPAILEKLSDNVQWEAWDDNSAQKAGVPWLLLRRGKAGALEFFKIVGEMNIKDFRVLSLMSGGNRVAAEIIIEAEMPGSGKRLRDEEIHLWTFDDSGKITRMRHYLDTAKHIAAAKK
jgi:hypothetical protein